MSDEKPTAATLRGGTRRPVGRDRIMNEGIHRPWLCSLLMARSVYLRRDSYLRRGRLCLVGGCWPHPISWCFTTSPRALRAVRETPRRSRFCWRAEPDHGLGTGACRYGWLQSIHKQLAANPHAIAKPGWQSLNDVSHDGI